MTLTLVSTFGSAGSGWAVQENGSGSNISLACTPANVGDVVLFMTVFTAGSANTGVSDSNNYITWDSSPVNGNFPLSNNSNGFGVTYFKGVVNTATATTLSVTGSSSIWGAYVCELHESVGTPTWTVVAGNYNNSSGATANFPTLTSGSATDQAYVGGLLFSSNGTVGSTSGFSYLRNSTLASVLCWNVALATTTGYAPTCNSGASAAYTTEAVIVSAVLGSTTVHAGVANVAVAAYNAGNPAIPADSIVGTPAGRMICWGGDEWLSQSAGTYATWKANGWGGLQFTTGSPYVPTSASIATATAGGFESYEGFYYQNADAPSFYGTYATNLRSVGMSGLSFDTEQNTWSAVSNATAQANGNAIAQAIWTAYPSMVLVYYHYFPPGGWNDVYEWSGLHPLYQQDYFFLGLLAGMLAVNATGRICLVDASFYRDATFWEAGANNRGAYFLNSQGSRAQLSQFFDQTTWNYACDHFDIAGFTWRGADGTGFYDNTEPPDSEWAQSVMDARAYSEGPRRAEYVFNSLWPPTPQMAGGANEPWSYTDPVMLGTVAGSTGAIPASSTSSLLTLAPTITNPTIGIVGSTVTITCQAAHAYGIRCVKVYNGATFNISNPSASYLGAMIMTFQPNGGSYTTSYTNAYQQCTFSVSGYAGQYFMLEAISIKDDTHWAQLQVPGGGTPGQAFPTTANVTVTAYQPSSITGGGSITAHPGVAAVTVAAKGAGVAVANVGVGWQPTWQLLVAFNNLPLDDPTLITTVASPPGTLGAVNVWTDITKDLRTQLDTNRGKQHEVDRTQTGSMTFTLDNRSGNYSTWNTSGLYTGKIKPGVPVQLRATFLGVTNTVFTGMLDTVAPGWTAPSYDAVTVTCFDLFNYLNNTYAIPNYPAVVAADGAQLYLRLNDVAGTARATDAISGNNTLINFGPVATLFGVSPGALVNGAWTAVDLANGTTVPAAYIDLNSAGLMTGSTWSIEVWYKVASPAAFTGIVPNPVLFKQYLDPTHYMSVYVTPGANQIGVHSVAGASDNNFFTTAAAPADGNWHYVVLTSNQTVYVDGVSVPVTALTSAAVSFTPAQGFLGYNHLTTPTWPGLVQEFAIYPTALTAAQVAAHYYAATVNVTETSDARIAHVAGWIGLPLTHATVYAGNSTLQPDTTNLAMTSTLSYLQAVEQTEAGLLYIDTAGHLKFVNRGTIYTALTSTSTFGDGGGAEIPFELNPQIATDTQDLYATVTLTRNNGATVTVGTQAGFNNYNISGLMGNSDSEIAGYANWFLTQLGTAKPRIRLVNVHPIVTSTTGAATNALLMLDLGTVVTVNRHTLPGAGTAFTQVSYVEGINFHLLPDTGDWNVDLQLTPLFPERPWILGVSQLGTDTNLFF